MADYSVPRPSSQPEGSTDLAVAKDDLITLDKVLVAESGSKITNRKGKKLTPLVDVIDGASSLVQEAIRDAGYSPQGDWAAGVEYTAYNQVYYFNKVAYKPLVIPYTAQGSDPTIAPDLANVSPVEIGVSELESIALSLNIELSDIIYADNTTDAIPAYIRNKNNSTTYHVPSGAKGKRIQVVDGNELITMDSEIYAMMRVGDGECATVFATVTDLKSGSSTDGFVFMYDGMRAYVASLGLTLTVSGATGVGFELHNGKYAIVENAQAIIEVGVDKDIKNLTSALVLASRINSDFIGGNEGILISIDSGVITEPARIKLQFTNLSNVHIAGAGIDDTTIVVPPGGGLGCISMYGATIGDITSLTIQPTAGTSNKFCISMSAASQIRHCLNFRIRGGTVGNEGGLGVACLNMHGSSEFGMASGLYLEDAQNGLIMYAGSRMYFGETATFGLNIINCLNSLREHEGFITGRELNIDDTGRGESAIAIQATNGLVSAKFGEIKTDGLLLNCLSAPTVYLQMDLDPIYNELISTSGMGDRVSLNFNCYSKYGNRAHLIDRIDIPSQSLKSYGVSTYVGDGLSVKRIALDGAVQAKVTNTVTGETYTIMNGDPGYRYDAGGVKVYSAALSEGGELSVYANAGATMNSSGVEYSVQYIR